MPLTPETTPALPNALLIPQIVLHTAIVNGQLQTRATVMLAGATVTNPGEANETWANAAGSAQMQLDLNNIPEDLAAITEPMLLAYGKIVEAIGIVNSVRKLL